MKQPNIPHGHPPLEEIDLSKQRFEDYRATELMEEMRKLIAPAFGVTVVGPYVTLRFKAQNGGHTEIFMQVREITNSKILEDIDPDWNK